MALLKFEKKVVEEVEVELPFYFIHDLDTCIVYGRVDETGCIQVTKNKNGFEVECEKTTPNHWTCYLKPGYSSNKGEFNEALFKAYAFINDLAFSLKI